MMSEVMNILGGALITILGVAITYGVQVGTAYLNKKKEETIAKIGAEEYNSNRQLAIDIAAVVEKRWSLGQVLGTKAEEFEKLLLGKVPGLKKETIDHLREVAVVELDKQLKGTDLFGEAKKQLN